MNPPGHARWAFDFIAVDAWGDPYFPRGALLVPRARVIENFHGWSQPVGAPFEGVVLGSSDGWPDNEAPNLYRSLYRAWFKPPPWRGDFRPFGGNWVVIGRDTGEHALFAHLRCGSVRVKVGDAVRARQVIGEVGNSGASIVPHLHFQLQGTAGEAGNPLGRALPFSFERVDVWDGLAKRWALDAKAPPTQRAVYRRRCGPNDEALAVRVDYLVGVLSRPDVQRSVAGHALNEVLLLAEQEDVKSDRDNSSRLVLLKSVLERSQLLKDLKVRSILERLATVAFVHEGEATEQGASR